MITEKDYCDYETCVALKELGFREKCPTYYDTEDNVGLLYNTQWALDIIPYQFTDCLESHNSNTSDDNSYIDAPNLYSAQKWLRERHNLHITIFSQSQESWQYRITKPHQKLEDGLHGEDFASFEEALSKGIKEAVKILKEK